MRLMVARRLRTSSRAAMRPAGVGLAGHAPAAGLGDDELSEQVGILSGGEGDGVPRADVMLRKALVSQPTSANVEAARTLLAAGRVEQRKRQAERAAGMVAEWVAAKGAA